MNLQHALLFAQDDREGGAAAGAAGAVVMLFYLAIFVIIIAAMWKLFTKAGKPGWAAIVPIYNIVVLLEIVGRPLWWIILFLIPCVSLIAAIIVWIDVAKSFGKSTAFAIGLILLPFVFLPILAFGDAQYRGPVASTPAI